MRKYLKSVSQLKRAELTIPIGSQTFSKSRTQYPVGISPLYATKGKGAYIWDLDGNKYIDLVNSLAAITLGYGDKKLDSAVRKQLNSGVILSLPSVLEAEVAEMIVELVPSAEMVRFSKNGSDATAAAIRLARAYTGRDHIIMCGYHGWHDWYVGSTSRNKGIPSATSELTHTFEFNNIDSLRKLCDSYKGQVAAVIMEPMNSAYPLPNFLSQVKELTAKIGAILIFDEVITGFRFSSGGAQQLFNVTPDLSTFGKGIANGFPLSAVVGKREIMLEMENVFLSGTFGGELLSLTAAKYVLGKHLNENICDDLKNKGELLESKVNEAINQNNLKDIISLSGHPTWKFINWHATEEYSQAELKTYFLQEIFQEGVLVLNSHNISQAHTDKVIKRISNSYFHVFEKINQVLKKGILREELKVEPLVPLFKVR
jgi:glutamate-1-semialdehyde 2,1-aminomutase